MKNFRSLNVIVPAIIIVAALVGFIITFQSSPPAAYGRIFIDLGVLVALMWACITIPKPRVLKTEDIVDGLRDLARGYYDKRLNPDELEELSGIARAFNELAGSLSDSADPRANRSRYQAVRRGDSQPKPITEEVYSHHPELGPVIAMAKEDTPIPESNQSLPPPPPPDLYAEFCEAHKRLNREPIDFVTFEQTIKQSRAHLMQVHQCRDVRFEVVIENNDIALRPRLQR